MAEGLMACMLNLLWLLDVNKGVILNFDNMAVTGGKFEPH
jgi:hypothetical protein